MCDDGGGGGGDGGGGGSEGDGMIGDVVDGLVDVVDDLPGGWWSALLVFVLGGCLLWWALS